MTFCEECNKRYDFDELKETKDKHWENCKIIKCPKDHNLQSPPNTIETMHMTCRTFLRKIDDMGKVKYICDKCKKKFSIEK